MTAETTGKVRPVPKTYLLPPVIKDEVTVHAHAKPLAKTCACTKNPTETSCRQVDHHLNVEENTVHARDRAWSDADEPAWCTHYLEDPLVRDRVNLAAALNSYYEYDSSTVNIFRFSRARAPTYASLLTVHYEVCCQCSHRSVCGAQKSGP